MNNNEGKDLKCRVSVETWKKIKVMAVMREVKIPDLVGKILEDFASMNKIIDTFNDDNLWIDLKKTKKQKKEDISPSLIQENKEGQ